MIVFELSMPNKGSVKNVDTEMVCEMYVIVHIALKEYDERRMGEADDKT